MQKYSKENDGYRYICVIIDCFSRYVWVKPLKNKTGKATVKALALLLMNERPKLIQADQGGGGGGGGGEQSSLIGMSKECWKHLDLSFTIHIPIKKLL